MPETSVDFIYFNSLPHTEVDVVFSEISAQYIDFNSLPHTEVDAEIYHMPTVQEYFNSLPHTEVDGVMIVSKIAEYISTHYLTQR